MNDNFITQKQLDYIKILSSYPDTKLLDLQDIKLFLDRNSKPSLAHLTKREAHNLIEILLNRPCLYTFICGKTKTITKQERNCYSVLGDMEGCLHDCPDGVDVNDCIHYQTNDIYDFDKDHKKKYRIYG